MKETELNPLNSNQRRLLQIGVVLILVLFLIGYFFVINRKTSNEPTVHNTSVYMQDGRLHIFDEIIPEPQYPDKIAMHYPYLLIVKPEQQTTTIYNLNAKKKVKDVKQVLLDYDGTNILYTKGKSTLFNTQDLGVLCQYGWIKSNQEVLCVTQVRANNVENKLVDITLSKNTQKDIYSSTNLITALSVMNNLIYLGEINLFNHKTYLVADKNSMEVPSIISMIYQFNNQPYFISLKSALNNKESYYLIENNKITNLEGKIYLLH